MATVIYKRHHYILLGAAASVAAASSIRRLTATCGLVLLAQVLACTTCITLVAMSSRPASITVCTDFQSAVLPNIFDCGWKSVVIIHECRCGKYNTNKI